MRQRVLKLLSPLAACALLAGCGPDNGLGMVRVSGKVTFDGGPCPASGEIGFGPIKPATPDLPRRGGFGKFDTDGGFVVTSFDEGDGLVPGRYGVKVTCRSGPVTDKTVTQEQIDALSYVPKGFDAGELVVEPGSGSITFNIDVPKKK